MSEQKQMSGTDIITYLTKEGIPIGLDFEVPKEHATPELLDRLEANREIIVNALAWRHVGMAIQKKFFPEEAGVRDQGLGVREEKEKTDQD